MKIIGIVGSRRRNSKEDFQAVEKAFLAIYEEGDEIVSGGCPKGADSFAEYLASKHQVPIKIHYAKWNRYGNIAGFMRNSDIAIEADILIACVAEDREGGTEDTIQKFTSLMKGKVIIV